MSDDNCDDLCRVKSWIADGSFKVPTSKFTLVDLMSGLLFKNPKSTRARAIRNVLNTYSGPAGGPTHTVFILLDGMGSELLSKDTTPFLF